MASREWESLKGIDNAMFKQAINTQQVQECYSAWAKANTYDKLTTTESETFHGIKKLVKVMDELFPKDNRNIPRILDVGAGTGLTTIHLNEIGFTNIDGLEPNDEFCKIIREKNLYKNIYQAFVVDENSVNIPNDTYDVIVVTASFCPGHIPYTGVEEFVRMTKPGGYFVFCMREEFLWTMEEYAGKFERLLNKLEADKKVKRLLLERYPGHYLNYDGVCHVYKVL